LKSITRFPSASDFSLALVCAMMCAGTASDNPMSLAAVIPSAIIRAESRRASASITDQVSGDGLICRSNCCGEACRKGRVSPAVSHQNAPSGEALDPPHRAGRDQQSRHAPIHQMANLPLSAPVFAIMWAMTTSPVVGLADGWLDLRSRCRPIWLSYELVM
jgi:hypothetical protein